MFGAILDNIFKNQSRTCTVPDCPVNIYSASQQSKRKEVNKPQIPISLNIQEI